MNLGEVKEPDGGQAPDQTTWINPSQMTRNLQFKSSFTQKNIRT